MSCCIAPFANCANDGHEFHMSRVERTDGGRGVGAISDLPYDPTVMNAYKVDDEANEINSYGVLVDITGGNGDEHAATCIR